MKIGFYDTDPAGGMIPMIIKLEEENIPFEKINWNNLNSMENLDLLIINYLGLPHFPKKVLKDYCENIKKAVELNSNTEFLIMVPGQEWAMGMDRRLGIHKNIDYVTNGDISKLTKLLEKESK